jgi:hypothetical protein
MNKNIYRGHAKSAAVAKFFGIVLVLAFLGGCGADWFPAYKRPATLPDPFSFTEIKDVEPGQPVTSNAITVAGVTADSSPITITGTSTSRYSINGGTPTATAGTVKNGDKVTVTHTTIVNPGVVTTSTLTIGGLQGAFTTVNQLVSTPSFSLVTPSPGIEGVATLVAADGAGIVHKISISDNSGGAAKYFVTDLSGTTTIVALTNATTTPLALNNDKLFVQVPNASVTVKLTIDNVEFDLAFTTSAITVTRVQPPAS